MKCTYSSNTSAKSTAHFPKYFDKSIVIEIMMWLLHAAMRSVCSVLSMNGKEGKYRPTAHPSNRSIIHTILENFPNYFLLSSALRCIPSQIFPMPRMHFLMVIEDFSSDC